MVHRNLKTAMILKENNMKTIRMATLVAVAMAATLSLTHAARGEEH
jgi:hypothetical protein